MVDNVNGLRPVGNSNQSVRRKEGRVADRKATRLTTALAPAAARVSTFKGVTAATQDKSSELLMNALGKLNPAINNFVTAKQSSDDETILNQAEYHMERIREELGNGTVTAVQVGELLPEASATVRAKITQSMGSRQGKEFIAPILDEIESDDTVRLSTELHNKRLEEAKAEALALSDDPFYANGVMSAINAKINQSEQRWQLETAKYHKDAVRDEYKDEIANTILNGGDLLEWDSVAKQTGPFMDRERNEIVTATAMDLAVESGNPEILNTVPERFLNAETKRKFAITQQQIKTSNWTEQTQQWQLQDRQRKDAIRNGQVEILNRFVETGVVRPSDYRNSPELYAFATSMVQRDSVNEVTSAATSTLLKEAILRSASGDAPSELLSSLGYYGDLSVDSLSSWIALNPDKLNAKDAVSLIKDLPNLVEGSNVMRDPIVSDTFEKILRPAIAGVRQSPNTKLQAQLNGANFEATVNDFYYSQVSAEFDAYREDNDQWPKRSDRLRIVREVQERTSKLIGEMTKIGNTGQTAEQLVDKVNGTTKRWNPQSGQMEVVNE